MKGSLPKAYLRIDPNLDQTHPDPGAFVRLLCAAARQPKRGRFKSWALVVSALGRGAAGRLRDLGDLRADGEAWVVPGWDTWQEGDLTVGERMARFRERHRNGTVTTPVTEPLQARTQDSKAARQQGSEAGETEPGRQARARPPANPLVDREALIKRGYELITLIARREDLDPTEVLSKASEWQGRGYVRLDTMHDDRLARTLGDLEAWWRRLEGIPEPAPPLKLVREEPGIADKTRDGLAMWREQHDAEQRRLSGGDGEAGRGLPTAAASDVSG